MQGAGLHARASLLLLHMHAPAAQGCCDVPPAAARKRCSRHSCAASLCVPSWHLLWCAFLPLFTVVNIDSVSSVSGVSSRCSWRASLTPGRQAAGSPARQPRRHLWRWRAPTWRSAAPRSIWQPRGWRTRLGCLRMRASRASARWESMTLGKKLCRGLDIGGGTPVLTLPYVWCPRGVCGLDAAGQQHGCLAGTQRGPACGACHFETSHAAAAKLRSSACGLAQTWRTHIEWLQHNCAARSSSTLAWFPADSTHLCSRESFFCRQCGLSLFATQ